jgi:hypothetical protein
MCVLRRIVRGTEQLRREKLHNLHLSRMRCVGHAPWREDKRNAYIILAEKP